MRGAGYDVDRQGLSVNDRLRNRGQRRGCDRFGFLLIFDDDAADRVGGEGDFQFYRAVIALGGSRVGSRFVLPGCRFFVLRRSGTRR